MLTLRKLNNTFAKVNPCIMLHKGKDYFYFIYWDGKAHESKMVSIAKVNDLTYNQWVDEFNLFVSEVF